MSPPQNRGASPRILGRAFQASEALLLSLLLLPSSLLLSLPIPCAASPSPPPPRPSPTIAGCPIFPANNAWNIRVDSLPVAANSDVIIKSIGASTGLHPDFGTVWNGYPIGISYNLVNKSTPRVYATSFTYGSESDNVPYPIPPNPLVEGPPGGDMHCLILDVDSCRLYELFYFQKTNSGGFTAGSGATWSLLSNALRPAGWTSADAAGLAILPGLARYEEYLAGEITHALRFTVERTQNTYVWPARHKVGSNSDPTLPPMGLRLRLKKSFDISTFPPQAKVVLKALQIYGMMVADIGQNWFLGGVPDMRWDDSDLHKLTQVLGSNFEVVDMKSVPHPDAFPSPPPPKSPPPVKLPPPPRSPPPSIHKVSPPPSPRRSPPPNPSSPPPPSTAPMVEGCPVFPANNAWNIRVDGLPVAANSDALVASIGAMRYAHPDFGTTYDGIPNGIPYNVVNSSRIGGSFATSFWYPSESDNVSYPVPPDVLVEGPAGGDQHCILVDVATCRLYELYYFTSNTNGGFSAGSGAVWSMTSNALRPAGWTSADAAGLQIFPGLARYEEVAAGAINHAISFTTMTTREMYVWPARHFTYSSGSNSSALPPMGLRLRLKQSFDITKFPPQAKIVLQALKTFGMMLADNGTPWHLGGVPDPRWDDNDLHSITTVPGSAFEVVDMSSVPQYT